MKDYLKNFRKQRSLEKEFKENEQRNRRMNALPPMEIHTVSKTNEGKS